MKLCRVIAKNRDLSGYTFTLVCGVTESDQLVEGEWYGCFNGDSNCHPFVLERGSACFYGGYYSEPTNFGSKLIKVGELFTVSSRLGEDEQWEAIYEITSCHQYLSTETLPATRL